MLTPYGCSSCQQSNSLLDLVKVFARKYNQLHTDWLPCQNNMKNSKNIGLTIIQIKKSNELKNKKIIFQETVVKSVFKKKLKPDRVHRQIQKHDMGLLLDLPYSITQTANHLPTPDWFEMKEKADVSIVVPMYMSSVEGIVESWDFHNDGMKVELIFIEDNCPLKSALKIVSTWENRIDEIKKPIGKIFQSDTTQGWGACCNIGAYKSSGKFIVFIRPDSKLFPGWLTNLIQIVDQPEVGAVGGLHVNEKEDTVYSAGKEWCWQDFDFLDIGMNIFKGKKIPNSFHMNNVPVEILQIGKRESINVDFMAVTKSNFLEMGGFSPNLFSKKWSNYDFCLSCIEKNKKILYQPNSRIYIEKKEENNNKYENHGEAYFHNKWINSGRINNIVSDKRTDPVNVIENILIRRRGCSGDVLIAAAVASALKLKYKHAKIIFATDFPNIVRRNPWIDQVISEYSERQFDLFFNLDMVYEYRPQTNILKAYADSVGVSMEDCKMYLATEELDLELPEKYVVMHSSNSSWVGRNWSPIKFDQISSKLKKEGFEIICVGMLEDHKPINCNIDLRGKTSVGQLATVIKKSMFFVGTDSFPMHVAQVFNIDGVAFFGSILPDTRLITENIRPVVADGIECLGCHHRKPTPCVSTNICEVGIQECALGVSVDRMWNDIKKIIEKLSINIKKI